MHNLSADRACNILTRVGLTLVFAFCSVAVNAQVRKSAARIILETEMKKVTVRAIIVGISEYANYPEESQLLYADDDAVQIYEFLRSKPEIDSANIHIILNSEAHGTSIKAQLYRILFKESERGDMVIFYFAGHGDVDATIEDGFLLMHDVSVDGDYFISDALQVSDIQRMITKAGANGVKVLLITDACRSGKFVGDSQGALHTTTALVREWQHVLKLVSCQLDQGSMEDERWGDGHGVFTFHLVNGLMGLADENKDMVVNFGEISDYVRTQVKRDTEYKQVPKSTGDETFSLFLVDTAALALAEQVMVSHRELFRQPATQRGIKMRGIPSDKISAIVNQIRAEIKNENLRGSPYFVNDEGTDILVSDIQTNVAHSKQIADLCYLDDHDIIITAAADNLVKTWQGTSLTALSTLAKHKAPVNCLVGNSKETEVFASGGMDNMIYLWNVRTRKTIGKIKDAHSGQVNDLVFTLDGQFLISSGNDNDIKMWSVANGKLVSTLRGHTANVTTLCLSPDGKVLVSGGEIGEVCVWDLQNMKLSKKLTGQKKTITTILFPKDNRSVITGSKGESIAIWNLDKSELIKSIVMKSSKEELLAGYNMDLFLRDKRGTIALLNTNSEKFELNSVKAKGVSVLRLSTANKRVFWVSGVGTLAAGDVSLPALKPSVLHLYGELLAQDISDGLRELIKAEVFGALVESTEKTIAQFIEGTPNLPRIEQVQYAITNLAEALHLYPDDSLLTRKVEYQKIFLEVQETLLSNDHQNYSSCIEKLDYIINELPNASFTYNTKSVIYQRLNEVDKARQTAEIAKEKTPSWTEPRNNLGKIYLEAGEYGKAIAEYEAMINIKPKSSKGYTKIGSIYHDLGDFKKAEKYYKESITVDSLNHEIYLKYSELQLSRGRFKDAERLLMKCNELDSLEVNSMLQSGRLYDYLFRNDHNSIGRISEAHRYLVKANEQFPKEPRTYTDLSMFYINNLQNSNRNAISFLYSVFDFEGRDSSELVKSIATEVKMLCETAIELNPYSSDALDGLAFAIMTLNKEADTEHIYLQAIMNNPKSPRVYCRYAKYSLDQGEIGKAIVNYKTAIQLDEKYLLAYIELWAIYREQDDMEGINYLFRKANINFPYTPLFLYKKSILPGHKASKQEIEKIYEMDENFYPASILAYNYNYKNLVGQPSEVEDQQYVTMVKRATRINDRFTIIQDVDMFGKPVYGLMHASGQITIAVEYDTIVKVDSKRVLAVRPLYSKIGSVQRELAGSYWYNLSGDLLKFSRIGGEFVSNGNSANKNNLYMSTGKGCYDLEGNILVPAKYDRIYHFSNGNRLIAVEKDGKYGCYNLYGQYVIPVKYDMIGPGFSVNLTPGVSCKLGAKSVMLNYLGEGLK